MLYEKLHIHNRPNEIQTIYEEQNALPLSQ
jgi:hypothetical protein